VDLVAAVVADEQSLEVMQPGEGALDDPAGAAEPGTVLGLAARDLGRDPKLPELTPILVVVVAAVGEHARGPSARASDSATHRRHSLDQRDKLRDVVAVAARYRPGKRDPRRVYEKVMLGAVSGSINRARARRGAPFFACT
jgi:hypothetical protein